MTESKILLMIPTYNEVNNVEMIYREIARFDFGCDILFVDDSSPDGTGELLDQLAAQHQNVYVLHRPSKMGIGSAHKDGIRWAYSKEYDYLATMDGDLTHTAQGMQTILAARDEADIVVANRFMLLNSLKDWSLRRRATTHLANSLTRLLLGMRFDATNSLRVYNLTRIPQETFALVRDQGYSFFWESLFIIWTNGHSIHEVPVELFARAEGQSKMTIGDATGGITHLIATSMRRIFDRGSLLVVGPYSAETAKHMSPAKYRNRIFELRKKIFSTLPPRLRSKR